MKTENKIMLIILLIIGISLISIISVSAQVFDRYKETSLKYHQKLQKQKSFETWEKNQPKKRLNEARFMLSVSREREKERNKDDRLNRQIEAIKERIK